jgi:hypothetical protein
MALLTSVVSAYLEVRDQDAESVYIHIIHARAMAT